MNTPYLISECYKNAQNTRISDNKRKKYENLSKKQVSILLTVNNFYYRACIATFTR